MFDWIKIASTLSTQHSIFCIATITKTKGSSPRKIGTKLIIEECGRFHGTIGGGNLEHLVLQKAKTVMASGSNEIHNFPLDEEAGQACGGNVDILFEVMGQGPKLFIFGAGHVGLAVEEILKETPFQTHLIDDRSEWISQSKYSITHPVHWKTFIESRAWDTERDFVVVMTPDHQFDQDIAYLLAPKKLKYLGVIGSKNKWASFKKKLKDRGIQESEIEKIKSPIGLIKAGNAPSEIAISLACELLNLLYNNH